LYDPESKMSYFLTKIVTIIPKIAQFSVKHDMHNYFDDNPGLSHSYLILW
jgi:hypothetical protein